MKNREIPAYARWAIAGLVCGFGLVGMDGAIGQDRGITITERKAVLKLGRAEVSGAFDESAKPTARITLLFKTESKEAVRLSTKAQLVREVFTGNPMSRVFNPKDRERSVLETKPISVNVSKGKPTKVRVVFETRMEEAGKGTVTYFVILKDGNREVVVDSATVGNRLVGLR